jgi:hypothetical protein
MVVDLAELLLPIVTSFLDDEAKITADVTDEESLQCDS